MASPRDTHKLGQANSLDVRAQRIHMKVFWLCASLTHTASYDKVDMVKQPQYCELNEYHIAIEDMASPRDTYKLGQADIVTA